MYHLSTQFGRYGGNLLLFSPSNTITSYGDRYPEGRTEESYSRFITLAAVSAVGHQARQSTNDIYEYSYVQYVRINYKLRFHI